MESERKLTSVGVGELGAAEEAQVARPGPDRLSVSETESGVEVIRLQDLLAVTAVVAAAVMSAVHPDLQKATEESTKRWLNFTLLHINEAACYYFINIYLRVW